MSVTNSNSLYGFNVTIFISVFPAVNIMFVSLFIFIDKIVPLASCSSDIGEKTTTKRCARVAPFIVQVYICFFFSLALICFISLCEKDHLLGPTLHSKYLTTMFCDSHKGSSVLPCHLACSCLLSVHLT